MASRTMPKQRSYKSETDPLRLFPRACLGCYGQVLVPGPERRFLCEYVGGQTRKERLWPEKEV